jgi:hypothetical protein
MVSSLDPQTQVHARFAMWLLACVLLLRLASALPCESRGDCRVRILAFATAQIVRLAPAGAAAAEVEVQYLSHSSSSRGYLQGVLPSHPERLRPRGAARKPCGAL